MRDTLIGKLAIVRKDLIEHEFYGGINAQGAHVHYGGRSGEIIDRCRNDYSNVMMYRIRHIDMWFTEAMFEQVLCSCRVQKEKEINIWDTENRV